MRADARAAGPHHHPHSGMHAREAFLMLKEKGHDLYLWSSDGAGYTATAAELLGLEA